MLSGESKVSAAQFDALSRATPANGRFLEVGTWHGATAAKIADLCPDALIVSVDDFSQCTPENYQLNRRPNMRLVVGAFCGVVDHPDLAEPFDVIFVDAIHRYPHCLNDLRAASKLLKPGGVIFAHDCDARLYPGVVRSVDEFCAESGFEIVSSVDRKSTLVGLKKQ